MESVKRSASPGLIRRLNSSAVLDLIRERSPLSRSEIARQLNISIPTVMRVVDSLFNEGLVRWTGDAETSGGRPRNLLELDAEGSAVVGLDLSGAQMYGTVADLGGHIQAEITRPWNAGDPQQGVEQLAGWIAELLDCPRPPGQRVRGIGVGAPGVTLVKSGVVTWAPSLGWRDLPLKVILEQRFGLPVVVENDVNLAALGEYGYGAARGAASAVCIAIGTGLGAGIILDRKIYRGFNHSAGELGYIPPDISALGRKYDGFGALEILASAGGIETRARTALVGSQPAAAEVFEAARRGERWAMQNVAQTMEYLAFATAAVSVLIDPEVIVLGGSLAEYLQDLVEPILKKLDGVIPVRPNLVASKLGGRAAVLGAILLVLNTTTEHVAVHGL
jgi:predicted NBD/HSP70 family sugar kinase